MLGASLISTAWTAIELVPGFLDRLLRVTVPLRRKLVRDPDLPARPGSSEITLGEHRDMHARASTSTRQGGPPIFSRPTTSLGWLALAGCLVIAACGNAPAAGGNTTPKSQNFPLAVVTNGPAVLAAQPLAGGEPTATLQLPGTPNTMVTTKDGSKAFLLDTSHGQVVPVDLTKKKVGAAISVGKLPVDEELSADGATLFVTDNLGGAVIAIDTATNSPHPAESLEQGVDLFAPSPTGSTGVVSFYSPSGQPGAIAFFSPASGMGASIEVGDNRVDGALYTPDGATVWVIESGVGNQNGKALPVDVRTHAVGAPIALGHGSHSAAMSPDGHRLVVTNSLDSSATIVDLSRRAVAATVLVGAEPVDTHITTDGATAWIACVLDRNLIPINLRSNTAGTPVQLSNSPATMATTPGAAQAWVLFPSSDGNVSFLSGNASLGHKVDVGNGPGMLISHDGKTAWVANSLSDTVQHIDLAKYTADPPLKVSRTPTDLVLSQDNKTLFVLSFGDGTNPGFLTGIDTATSKLKAPVAVGPSPSSLTLTTDGTTAFVANHQASSISTVNIKTWQAGPPISLPCSPGGLVMTPESSTLYANCESDGVVVPITVSGRKVGDPISVGGNPRLSMSHQGKRLFVNQAQSLLAIDTAANRVAAQQAETSNIIGIAITPDDRTLVGIDNLGGALVIIDATSLKTIKSVSVGKRPDTFALSPDGTTAYVLDTSKQKLYIVDVPNAKVISSIGVPPNASDVVVPETRT